MKVEFSLDFNPIIAGIEKAKLISLERILLAKMRVAMQMLTYMNTGSPNEPLKPPIRFGILRGSGSVFVGDRLVGVANEPIKGGADERPTPLTAYSAPPDQITVVYNTAYAAKMHEWEGGWGPYTLQDGSAGAKWIERHIMADGPLLMQMFANELKAALV